MKEIVDRILNGETVDIAGDGANYYLSVLKEKELYKVGFVKPGNLCGNFQILNLKDIKVAGELLIELANELESRTKFKNGDDIYYIRHDGSICSFPFYDNDVFHYSLVMSGNAFKTKEEAKKNMDAISAKYQDLRDRGLI